jgi:uncharacterized membrane-anchored protein|tara:strand:+ start:936 stop:1097 length:162 start_codon:yes stop_codon:yes gene_type:complete
MELSEGLLISLLIVSTGINAFFVDWKNKNTYKVILITSFVIALVTGLLFLILE